MNQLSHASAVLSCRRFKGTFSFHRIAALLCEIYSEFGLEHEQLISTITDNGSNFVKAFQKFGLKASGFYDAEDCLNENEDDEVLLHAGAVNSEENPELDSKLCNLPCHLRCASHTLNLVATTDFHSASRIHHPAIAKCSSLWNLSRRPRYYEIIHEVLGIHLLYPYGSIAQFVKHKYLLNILIEKMNLDCSFKDIEIEYLEEYCLGMKPLATALNCLQSEANCFYEQLLPMLISLRHRLENLQENNLCHLARITVALVSALYNRFTNFFYLSLEVNEAILASFFYPAFKLRWLPDSVSERERK